MKKRNLSEEEITHSIKNPDRTHKEEGKYYVQKNIGRAKIEVVFEKEGSV
ncbi:MAG TPA: hypothetical protein VJH65_03025 [Candidatus Nanoarchaeia archaeon]|nr:hypothetical protein [Candidatus Nanoarchaeia archaeon]